MKVAIGKGPRHSSLLTQLKTFDSVAATADPDAFNRVTFSEMFNIGFKLLL